MHTWKSLLCFHSKIVVYVDVLQQIFWTNKKYNPLWLLIDFLCFFGATGSAFFLGRSLNNIFHSLWQILKLFSVFAGCFAESSSSFFIDTLRCGQYWVLGDMGNNTLWEMFLSFTCVAKMLRKCALKCKWCEQRIQNGIDSILLSDFNVSRVLYIVFIGLLVIYICPVSHSAYFENFTKFAKVLCKNIISFELLEMR